MYCKLRCFTMALTLAATWSGRALATDDSAKGAARELASEAKDDFDAGRFEAAERKFQRAYEIANIPVLALWTARSLARQGDLVGASEFYRQTVHLAPNDFWAGNAQQQAQADAARELDELQPRIPRLRIRIEGSGANDVEVAINDVKIASALVGIEIPKNPGRWHVVGKKGVATVEQTIELGEGEHKEAVLTFVSVAEPPPLITKTIVEEPPPPPQPPVGKTGSRRTWGWIAASVGAAGLLTGAVTGIVVASNTSLRNECPSNPCSSPKVNSGQVSTYNLMRNISTAGFVVGGLGAAAGVTLLLWTPKRESEASLALWLGPSSAGVEGAF